MNYVDSKNFDLPLNSRIFCANWRVYIAQF